MTTKDALIADAQILLRKKFENSDIESALKIAKALEKASVFTYARRLRFRVYQNDPSNKGNIEKLAVATYKDDDLPNDLKFDAAANLIYKHFGEEPGKIMSCEAACILGSIFKKLWQSEKQIKHLFSSLDFYQRGYDLWQEARKTLKDSGLTDKDLIEKKETLPANKREALENFDPLAMENLGRDSYAGINLAFVYNLLAAQFKNQNKLAKAGQDVAADFEEKASEVRRELLKFFNEKKDSVQVGDAVYWFNVSWVEALVGLGKIEEAAKKLDTDGVPQWQLESSGKQLTQLTDLLYPGWNEVPKNEIDKSRNEQLEVLFKKFFGKKPTSSQGVKVGLALSGGGFRASIYHIGVLAKLAEANLLKDVEVISCVSGGSIIGAYYYLKIKKLLEEKPDHEITREDYIALVRQIEDDFLKGVSTNLRLRVFHNPIQNFKIGFTDQFTRTARLADLYESELYGPLLTKPGPDKRIYMDDLFIKPFDSAGFNIRRDNATRVNKAPMLVLNATSLNTGHCWQFTASWMGEPPGYINNEHDARPTYRRMYYREAPEKYRHVRLATAVSASSCVPGLFAPVTFEGLYEPGRTLQLVDGGVFDNQGVNTLLEQECNSLIISDASGQMTAENQPGDTLFSVSGRTNSILQERIRDCVFFDLKTRHDSGLVHGYLMMHLTKSLPSEVVDWYPCDDKYEFIMDETDEANDLTPYEIRKKVQAALAKVRTDLDAFHETESFALMYAGYKMTDYELRKGRANSNKHAPPPSSGWHFERIIPQHDDPEKNLKLMEKLDASDALFGKLLALSKTFKISVLALLLAGVICLLHFVFEIDFSNLFSWKVLFWPLAAAAVVLLDVAFLGRKSITAHALRLGIAVPVMLLLLWPIFLTAKWLFNRFYLYAGRVR